MSRSVEVLLDKIEQFKRKYYFNQLIKGLILALGLVVSLFLFVNSIEFFGRLSSSLRAVLLFIFIGASIYTFVFLLAKPILYFLKLRSGVSRFEAAADIGRFFPEIGDKLINTLQLSSLTDSDNSLLAASIEQKTSKLRFYQFTDAINLNDNRKYLKYSLPPLLLLLLISAISPSFFKSSERIIRFRQEFAEEAPFQFVVENKKLKAYHNESFDIRVKLEGSAIPEEVFLVYNDRRFKMEQVADKENHFHYEFSKLQQPLDFKFSASGFNSGSYSLEVLHRPELLSFDVLAKYPAYLGKSPDKLANVGNLLVPEGTQLIWNFKTQYADSLALQFEGSKLLELGSSNGLFAFKRTMQKSEDYRIMLKNNESVNDEQISYYINVIPDEYPKITVDEIRDSTLFSYIALGGDIVDDYGFTNLKLKYRIKSEQNNAYTEKQIAIVKNQLSQSYFFQFDLNPLNLSPGQTLEYYLEVSDNDGVNGAKTTKSNLLTFSLPNSEKFDLEVEKQLEKTEDKMENLLRQSKEIKNTLEKLDDNLKSKKELDYQDKKKIEELLKKREQMMRELEALQREFDQLQNQQSRFQEQNPETQKKLDQLQNLLNEILKDEQSELYKEMQKLLEENNQEQIQEQLEKMKQKDRNLDREIDRTLKLFQNLQLKQKVEELTKDLKELAKKQSELAEKTEKAANDKKSDELNKEQKQLNNEFEKKKEELKEVEKLSKELKKEIEPSEQDQKEATEEQKAAEKSLNENQKNAASKAQKKAAKAIEKLAESLSNSMQDAEMKQLELDLEALRALLENLVKLSFDQERIMQELRGLSRSDPRFVSFSQQQLKLVDDAKVVEDSLFSLSQTVMQIEAMITKEVTTMKNNMDDALNMLKKRDVGQAASKQQFSMTSINNLALMLNDTQKQMNDMMNKPGSGSKSKSGLPKPGLGDQQSKLNQRLEGLGKSGKKPSELSKELAQIAMEQAKIRRQVEDMLEKMNGTKEKQAMGDQLKEMQKQMDKAEEDLLNKRVTPNLIKRQKQMETRLLEIDKAMKEQELDPKRKAKTATDIKATPPPSLEQFLKGKQKQTELIRTTPPNFTPFYKQQTDNYFKSL